MIKLKEHYNNISEKNTSSDKKMLSLEGWKCLEQPVFFLRQKFQEFHCDSLWSPISTCDERPPEAVMAGRCRAVQLPIWRLKRRKLGVWWTNKVRLQGASEGNSSSGGSVELRWMIWSPVHQRTVCVFYWSVTDRIMDWSLQLMSRCNVAYQLQYHKWPLGRSLCSVLPKAKITVNATSLCFICYNLKLKL